MRADYSNTPAPDLLRGWLRDIEAFRRGAPRPDDLKLLVLRLA